MPYEMLISYLQYNAKIAFKFDKENHVPLMIPLGTDTN